MELTEQYLGQRIERARVRAGLSQAELAEAVGLSQSAISRIESGRRAVTSLELAAIAERLAVPVADLLEAQSVAEELRVAAREVTADGIEPALGRVIDLLRFMRLLDDVQGRASQASSPPPPGLSGTDVNQGRSLAQRVRRQWSLDDDPLPGLLSVVEEQAGLPVALEPLNERAAGLIARSGESALALVDSSVALGRQRFTVAHELCHFLCGDGDRLLIDRRLFGQDRSEERRANAFAAHFLMPEKAVRRYLRARAVDGGVAVELQHLFGVSLDALLWHLINMGVIEHEQREEISAHGARSLSLRHGYAAEWEQAESSRGIRRPPAPIYERALGAYSHGLIGIEALADFAGRTDIDGLRRELEDSGVEYDERWWDTGVSA